jgi:hypothetical protein
MSDDVCLVNGRLEPMRRISPAEQATRQRCVREAAEAERGYRQPRPRERRALVLLSKARGHLLDCVGADVASLIDDIDLLLEDRS